MTYLENVQLEIELQKKNKGLTTAILPTMTLLHASFSNGIGRFAKVTNKGQKFLFLYIVLSE